MKNLSILRSIYPNCLPLRRCAWALLPLLVAGCAGTFHDVKSLTAARPPVERPTTLVLENVPVTDAGLSATEKEIHQLKFRQGVQEWFAKTNVFETVLVGNNTNPPPHSIFLGGTIQEVEKGSGAARFWIGMGAGQARVSGEFTIEDSAGNELARFRANRTYLGGTGIGGGTMLSMEDLTFRLGQTVAETTWKWVQGKKIE